MRRWKSQGARQTPTRASPLVLARAYLSVPVCRPNWPFSERPPRGGLSVSTTESVTFFRSWLDEPVPHIVVAKIARHDRLKPRLSARYECRHRPIADMGTRRPPS